MEITAEQNSARVADGKPAGAEAPAGKLYVLGVRTGRLANRLVLFANFIALAEEYRHRVINVAFHSYSGFFEATRRDILCRYPPVGKSRLNAIPGVAETIRATRIFYRAAWATGLLSERMPFACNKIKTVRAHRGQKTVLLDSAEFQTKIREARIIFPLGWRFRAPSCVRKHAGKVRDYFHPVKEIQDASSEAAGRLRQRAEVVVGVHIRRGDYETWKKGKYFFQIARYAEWMRELAKQFPGRKVAFLICSNEPRSPVEFPGLEVQFGPGQPMTDLYALAACDYVFGPLSTFSQWASFYGNVPLFHPRDKSDTIDPGKFAVSGLEEVP